MNNDPEPAIGRWEKQLGDLPGQVAARWIIPGTDCRIEIEFDAGYGGEYGRSSWDAILKIGVTVECFCCSPDFERCDEEAKEYMRAHHDGIFTVKTPPKPPSYGPSAQSYGPAELMEYLKKHPGIIIGRRKRP